MMKLNPQSSERAGFFVPWNCRRNPISTLDKRLDDGSPEVDEVPG
jgi:hypothetical protein